MRWTCFIAMTYTSITSASFMSAIYLLWQLWLFLQYILFYWILFLLIYCLFMLLLCAFCCIIDIDAFATTIFITITIISCIYCSSTCTTFTFQCPTRQAIGDINDFGPNRRTRGTNWSVEKHNHRIPTRFDLLRKLLVRSFKGGKVTCGTAQWTEMA